MVNKIFVAFLLFSVGNVWAENSMEDSSTKLLLTWDVELTRVYDQFTNKIHGRFTLRCLFIDDIYER